MWNDIELQCKLLDVFQTEEKAFRWLFTPLPSLGRTPMEIIASGEKEFVLEYLQKTHGGEYS